MLSLLQLASCTVHSLELIDDIVAPVPEPRPVSSGVNRYAALNAPAPARPTRYNLQNKWRNCPQLAA